MENFNVGDYSAFGSMALIGLCTLYMLLSKGSAKSKESPKKKIEKSKLDVKVQTVPWSERLNKGLSKSRTEVWMKVGNIFGSKVLDQESLDEIEELLYTADMSPHIVEELIKGYKSEISKSEAGLESFKKWTFNFLNNKLDPIQSKRNSDLFTYDKNNHKELKVFMIVGVNGAGKTTTIGKLATKLKEQGATVVVGACDTFRAAAVEQLEVWCQRAGVEMIRAKEGADPSGVAYDTLVKAKNLKADYCLLDTAGRLHTKVNLMKELEKTKGVLSKLDNSAPHEVLLVIDSITGQNALAQAEEFNKSLKLTGLVLTKCDGSSKAGNAVSIVSKLEVPIAYIGVGESVEDLEVFQTKEYLNALLG